MRLVLASALAIGALSPCAAFATGAEPGACFDKGTLRYHTCPTPAPAPAPDPVLFEPPDPLWTGFYAGPHLGWTSAAFDGGLAPPGGPALAMDFSAADVSGPLVGGQVGYDHRFDNNVVVSVEADGSLVWAEDDLRAAGQIGDEGPVQIADAALRLDWLASLRARVGYAREEVLPFVTAGLAWAGYGVEVNAPGGSGERDAVAFGAVFGGGVDWAVSEDWSLRAEALYYRFNDDESLEALGSPGDAVTLKNVLAGRVAANFRF